jgi:hypothetical protein
MRHRLDPVAMGPDDVRFRPLRSYVGISYGGDQARHLRALVCPDVRRCFVV